MSTWKFTAKREGSDILVENVRATCFGGDADPQDSGETASGLSTIKFKWLAAVALPMRYTGTSKAMLNALGGSPIPKVPWGTLVRVTDLKTGKSFDLPVIDLGPARKTGNAIDLTVAAARLFTPLASATNFSMRCSYRVLGMGNALG